MPLQPGTTLGPYEALVAESSPGAVVVLLRAPMQEDRCVPI